MDVYSETHESIRSTLQKLPTLKTEAKTATEKKKKKESEKQIQFRLQKERGEIRVIKYIYEKRTEDYQKGSFKLICVLGIKQI